MSLNVHPTLKKLAQKAPSSDVTVLEGYVGRSDSQMTRLFYELTGGAYMDLPSKAILHDEPVPGDESGKVRVYVERATRLQLTFQTTDDDTSSGTRCYEGVMLCWKRYRLPGGGFIVLYLPCGSCPTDEFAGGGNDVVAH